MSKQITVHSYAHGGISGQRPRMPMVYLLATNECGDVASITFHPIYAESIANAIVKAAKSAKAGRGRAPIAIKVSETIG